MESSRAENDYILVYILEKIFVSFDILGQGDRDEDKM